MTAFNAPECWPFASALAVMVILAVLEGAGLLVSFSPSHYLDSLIPDMPDGIDSPLGWLHLGKVPVLVLLILFLGGFALAGYVIQIAAYTVVGTTLPVWGASVLAMLAGVASTRAMGGLVAKLVPRDETSAVSEQSLIGRAGVIVRGIAREGYAAEAKVRDMHGRVHYVMVEPDMADQTFDEGTSVLLVRKIGARFRCILNPHPELL